MRRLLLLPLLLAACAQPDEVAQERPLLHTGSGTVLESPQHGPQLCAGTQDSYPPQCGGVPLADWDWSVAAGEESAHGTTWGEFSVTGRWDGTTLTLTEPPGPPRRPERDEDPVQAGCDDPLSAGSAGTGEEALRATFQAARAEADHAGLWVDGPVLSIAFTGDLPRHEAQVRRTWGGPLCLLQHARSLAELDRIQGEVTKQPGLQVTSSWTSEDRNVVHLGVVAIAPEQQRALDERYGAGTVEVQPMLAPVR